MCTRLSCEEIFQLAISHTRSTMNLNLGGPFGAAMTDEDGQVIAVASNTVIGDHDPTAHAEINAIRAAAKLRGSYDLSGCTLYATAYPCPMCLSAIIWANIHTVYYGCDAKDAASIGFRDDDIYDFIRTGMDKHDILSLETCHREKCLQLFSEYATSDKLIY